MIAQNALNAAAQAHQAAQGGGRIWAPVDHVTQHVQVVATGRKINCRQQAGERLVTALNVAYQIIRHVHFLC